MGSWSSGAAGVPYHWQQVGGVGDVDFADEDAVVGVAVDHGAQAADDVVDFGQAAGEGVVGLGEAAGVELCR